MNFIDIIYTIAIPSAFALVPGFIAFYFARLGKGFALPLLGAVWVGFTAWMVLGMNTTAGYEPLGYFLGLLFGSAPAALGIAVGEVAGRNRRKGDEGHANT